MTSKNTPSVDAEVHGVAPDCEHRTLIHLAESPLWACKDCEGELPIAAWRELKARVIQGGVR